MPKVRFTHFVQGEAASSEEIEDRLNYLWMPSRGVSFGKLRGLPRIGRMGLSRALALAEALGFKGVIVVERRGLWKFSLEKGRISP